MNSKKSTSPSRSSHRATARRTSAATAKRSRVAVTKRVSPPVKADRPVATPTPLAKRVLQKVKTKTGLAVAAGVVLAGLGLARKLRAR